MNPRQEQALELVRALTAGDGSLCWLESSDPSHVYWTKFEAARTNGARVRFTLMGDGTITGVRRVGHISDTQEAESRTDAE